MVLDARAQADIDEINNMLMPEVSKTINFGQLQRFFRRLKSTVIGNDTIFAENLKWCSIKDYTMKTDSNKEDARAHGIPIIDFFIALDIIRRDPTKSITFKKPRNEKKTPFTLPQYAQAYGLFFYFLIARDDLSLSDTIVMPALAERAFNIRTIEEYRALISYKKLDKLDLTVIFTDDWSDFPIILKERFVAGSRYMRIFAVFPVRTGLPTSIKRVVDLVVKKAKEGMYLEYHPRCNPNQAFSLCKNLEQLLLIAFDESRSIKW